MGFEASSRQSTTRSKFLHVAPSAHGIRAHRSPFRNTLLRILLLGRDFGIAGQAHQVGKDSKRPRNTFW